MEQAQLSQAVKSRPAFDLPGSYRGKRVLVTGADGFMGSHLTEELLRFGAKVSILIRSTSKTGTPVKSLRNLPQNLHDSFEHILCGDIGSPDIVRLIVENQPQIILNLAAAAYVNFSFDHPLEVNQTNLNGTLHVLEAARLSPEIERVVHTSSSEIYGTAQTEKIAEDHPLNPSSPYGASKAASDRYCYSYIFTYNLPIAVIRPFNTFGPRHTYDVIPKFIKLAMHGEPITVYGTGEQSRDFTYVADTVRGFLLMGTHPKAHQEFINFGTGTVVTINEVAEKIVRLTKSRSQIVHLKDRAGEVNKLIADSSKAKDLLGWEPQVTFAEGLERNVKWALENWK